MDTDDAAEPGPGSGQQPQQIILQLLGEFVPSDATVWSGGLVTLLGDLGITSGSARISLNRIVTRGLLERERTGRLIHYRGTSRLESLLRDIRAFVFTAPWEAEWDGRWTVLSYSIPEDRLLERRRLSRRLDFFGFGALQDGVWISPRNRLIETDRLIEMLGVRSYCLSFVTQAVSTDQVAQILERAWSLDNLHERYSSFIDRYRPYVGDDAISRLTDRESFILRTRMMDDYQQDVSLDPALPDDAMGQSWLRHEASEIFALLHSRLRPGAERHFLNTVATD